MKDSGVLEKELYEEFEQSPYLGRAAPHECLECDDISVYLNGRSWREIEPRFVGEFYSSLPLLSDGAYQCYLPAWIKVALNDPDSDVAAMLLIDLTFKPRVALFKPRQRELIVRTGTVLARNNLFGENDPSNAETIEKLAKHWLEYKE